MSTSCEPNNLKWTPNYCPLPLPESAPLCQALHSMEVDIHLQCTVAPLCSLQASSGVSSRTSITRLITLKM